MNTIIDQAELLRTAEKAARKGGDLIREMWSQPRQVDHKGFRDLVTDADLSSQATIVELIRGRYPEHGFLTEEEDPDLALDGRYVWIIDPVDGTSNYSRQVPIFCISIAVADNSNGELGWPRATQAGESPILAGVIYDPMGNELFSAAAGQGSYLNGAPIQVSDTKELASAIVALDWSRQFERRQTLLNAVGGIAHRVHTIRAVGSAALALAWLAAGRLDAYLNLGLGPWDVAAASVLIREAGGRVTNLQDRRWTLEDMDCIASNGRLHWPFLDATGLMEMAELPPK